MLCAHLPKADLGVQGVAVVGFLATKHSGTLTRAARSAPVMPYNHVLSGAVSVGCSMVVVPSVHRDMASSYLKNQLGCPILLLDDRSQSGLLTCWPQ